MIYRRYIKPAVDRVLALALLILFSPLLFLIAIAVRLNLGSPVFFRQERGGLNGKVFRVVKFRTMTADCDSTGELLPDSKRLCGVGKWIRRSSLDELPQLVNVFKGDMSFIGPRPLLAEYLPLYSAAQQRRHAVKPGITGLAQVSGRNLLSWDERFGMDVDYVESVSCIRDLKILFLTLKGILRGKGIDTFDGGVMPKFTGVQRTQTSRNADESGV